tara:strand:+ start:114382 stop:115089 length:708 start_codon:yes stop_codon:yes gene_type:complete
VFQLDKQIADAPEYLPHHKHAHHHKGEQFDQAFKADGQHQPVLVFAGVDMTGAEQHRKHGHQQRHRQGAVDGPAAFHAVGEAVEGHGHRFQLQGDVGDGAGDGHQGNQNRQRLGFTVARGDEISDGGNALLFADGDDLEQHGGAQDEHDHGAKVDRQKIPAEVGGLPHGAEKRPGGAVHRQGEAVQPGAVEGLLGARRTPVAVPGDQKQYAGIGQRKAGQCPDGKHSSAFFTLSI